MGEVRHSVRHWQGIGKALVRHWGGGKALRTAGLLADRGLCPRRSAPSAGRGGCPPGLGQPKGSPRDSRAPRQHGQADGKKDAPPLAWKNARQSQGSTLLHVRPPCPPISMLTTELPWRSSSGRFRCRCVHPETGLERNVEMGGPGADPLKCRLWMGVFHANNGFMIMAFVIQEDGPPASSHGIKLRR